MQTKLLYLYLEMVTLWESQLMIVINLSAYDPLLPDGRSEALGVFFFVFFSSSENCLQLWAEPVAASAYK